MSYPSYLNTIIYSQIKNQQIEQVRNQIAKFISIDRISFKHPPKNTQQLKPEGTTLNFYQVNFPNQRLPPARNAYLKGNHEKIIDKNIPYKTKKRMSLAGKVEFGKQKNNLEENQKIVEWKKQMLMHLKSSKSQKKVIAKADELPPKEEKYPRKKVIAKADELPPKEEKYPRIIQKSKSIDNVPKKQQNQLAFNQIKANSQGNSYKNIILINPFSFQNHEEEAAFKFIPKFRKSFHKNEPNLPTQNHLTLQSLTNFYALVPYLDSRKAHPQAKIGKKKKYQPVFEAKTFQKREDDEFRGNICGWESGSKYEQ